MKKHTICTLTSIFFFIVSISLYGNIEIKNINHPTNENGSACNGSIELVLDGESGPFDITIIKEDDPGFASEQEGISATFTVNNLCVGMYTILVSNDFDCTVELYANLIDFNCPPKEIIIVEYENVSLCNKYKDCDHLLEQWTCLSDGKIAVEMVDPGNYVFNWSGPLNFSSSSANLSGLSVGSYRLEVFEQSKPQCVTVKDFEISKCSFYEYNNGACVIDNPYESSELSLRIDPNRSTDGLSCNGSISLSIENPNQSAQFYWRDSDGNRYFEQNIRNLCEGEYCYFFDDGCSEWSKCVSIFTCPNEIFLDAEVSPGREGEGQIKIKAEGGIGNVYHYNWGYHTKETIEGPPIKGAGSPVISELTSGTYVVTVSDITGCYSIKIVSLTNYNCDADSDGYTIAYTLDYGNKSFATCSGLADFEFTVSGGESGAPVDVTIFSDPETNEGEFWKEYHNLSSWNTTKIITNLKRGRYYIKSVDKCGNTRNIEIDMCSFCGFEYEASNQIYEMFNGGISMEIKCPCDFNCSAFNPFSKSRMKLSWNVALLDKESTYKITWPEDGGSFWLQFINGAWEYSGNKDYDITRDQFEANEALFVSVNRQIGFFDQNCNFEVPVIFGGEGGGNIVFVNHKDQGSFWDLSDGKNIADFHLSNYACLESCNTSSEAEYLVDGDGYFNSVCPGGGSAVQVFEYNPNNTSNTNGSDDVCSGGGTVKAWVINSNKEITREILFTVPENLDFVHHYKEDRLGRTEAIMDCTDGGACIFKSEDIFPGLELDKDLFLQYCNNFSELSDEDGDGIPDSEDPCFDDPLNLCWVGDNGNFVGGSDDLLDECVSTRFIEKDCVTSVICKDDTGFEYEIEELIPQKFEYEQVVGSICYIKTPIADLNVFTCGCNWFLLNVENMGEGVAAYINEYSESFWACEDLYLNFEYCESTNIKASKIYKDYANQANIFSVDAKDTMQNSSILNEEIDLTISLYPNPFNDILKMNLDKRYDNLSIEIMSIRGELIRSEKVQSNAYHQILVKTNELPQGVYFIGVLQEGELIRREKIVKITTK